ncbi:MAG: sulfite exporter TauE/SafE family protein [Desulfobulbaceae bacterium]|nr:sulfite exporter TauE/SafE family protein [Desulfobulbaceae bacterium]
MPQDIMLYLGAIALGALHAFEPGHGKTLIAAYMIGTRGRAMDGVLLGLIVTFTHTFSVILLGIVAKILSHTYSETQLHAWLGLGSSALILAVGIWMLKQRLGGNGGHHFHLFGHGHHHGPTPTASHTHDHDSNHGHDHDAGHGHQHPAGQGHHHDHDHHAAHSHDHNTHDHHGHSHDSHHAGHGHHHTKPSPVAVKNPYNKWNLLVLGISGGLVPCPAAIATLLAAIAAGRIAQGLTMAIFFSVGLGAVMMIIGVVLSHAGRLTEQIAGNQEFSRRMGILSAVIITLIGAYTLYHSLQGLASGV